MMNEFDTNYPTDKYVKVGLSNGQKFDLNYESTSEIVTLIKISDEPFYPFNAYPDGHTVDIKLSEIVSIEEATYTHIPMSHIPWD